MPVLEKQKLLFNPFHRIDQNALTFARLPGQQGNLAAMSFEKAPRDAAFHHPLKVTMERRTTKR